PSAAAAKAPAFPRKARVTPSAAAAARSVQRCTLGLGELEGSFPSARDDEDRERDREPVNHAPTLPFPAPRRRLTTRDRRRRGAVQSLLALEVVDDLLGSLEGDVPLALR